MQRRDDQQSQDESPSKKRTKVVWIIVVGVAFMVGMWFWIGWYSLLILGVIVWATWDGIGFSGRGEDSINKRGWSSPSSSV
jgi:asparagine N-glycosylation enzyme membrane subunit Stt3